MRNLLVTMASFAAVAGGSSASPKALVYRGPAACDGCPEAVAHLLESSPWKFEVMYAGPKEGVEINEESLNGVSVYAQPGGPDLDDAWDRLKGYKTPLQSFVSSGGFYLGFCLGAFLAGHTPGFGLLPSGSDTDAEISQPKSQVKSEKDTIIQVDWTFVSGKTEKSQWVYFQDGAIMTGLDEEKINDANGKEGRILAKYSKSGDVAASVTPYGKGRVGLVGPHPEATQDWYDAYNIKNPDGISFKIGYDFIAATLNGSLTTDRTVSPTPTPTSATTSSTSSSAAGRVHMNPMAGLTDHVVGILGRKQ